MGRAGFAIVGGVLEMPDDMDAPLQVTEAPEVEAMSVKQGETGIVEVPYPALNDYFNLTEPNSADRQKMAEIWEYFGNEAENVGDLMYKVRQLENRLASPMVGESRLQNVYKYVKISAQMDSDEKRRDSLLRH